MVSIRNLLKQQEFWIYVFVLGVILLNWPIISAATIKFGTPGITFVLFYLAAIWILIIILLFLFERESED
jgi:heme/copper-type cytochrome/quinol oxidase subunit 4